MKRLIRFDWAIKRLLRNKANFGILEGFLSELLGYDIKIDSILESETNQDTKVDKYNKVDLLVRNSIGELIIIEVQNEREQDYLMRIVYGVSKLMVENMDIGMPYSAIKKIISVNICFFDLGQGEDYVYHGTTKFEGLHYHDILQLSPRQQTLFKKDKIAKLLPEYYIIKVNQFDEIARNTLDEWIYFFKTEEIKDEFKAKGLREAKQKLDILKLSEHDRKDYERWVENERYGKSLIIGNYEDGLITGEENKERFAQEKVKQKQMEIAIKCLRKGMAISDIVELTGLTEDEIKKIKY